MPESFHLFAWPDYYPSGGMQDYVRSFPSLREAMAYLAGYVIKPNNASVAVQRDGELVPVAYYYCGDWTLI